MFVYLIWASIVTYVSWSGLKRCILIVSLLQVLS